VKQKTITPLEIEPKTPEPIKVRLFKSLSTITWLIEMGNEDLWPIFEKLENELISLNQRQIRLTRYSTQ